MKTKMTRITSLFLAATLLLLTFTGCSKEPELAEGPALAELAETDTLVLYISSQSAEYDMRWIKEFSELYDIDVEVVKVVGQVPEMTERITNDLAAGVGPDVFFLSDLYRSDIMKIAANGNLLDLTNILAEDPDFSEEDYVAGILDAGKYKGRQYMIPYAYELPLMLSSTEKLESLGFDWNNVNTTSDFLDEAARVMPIAEEDDEYEQMLDGKNRRYLLFPSSGVPLVNYETGEVFPDEAGLKQMLEAYKPHFSYDYSYEKGGLVIGYGEELLAEGTNVFWWPSLMGILAENISLMKSQSIDYTLRLVPGQTGEIVGNTRCGLVGINASTANTLNAYRLIKYILSEEAQMGTKFTFDGIPVRLDAIRRILEEEPAWEKVGQYGVCDFENLALTEEEVTEIYELVTNVDRFIVGMPFFNQMMMDSMLPYMKDEQSYDSCIKDLRSKLKFYLSE